VGLPEETCDLQILGNAWKCLRDNLRTKNIFFLKVLNFVQSFVEFKVSLADGIFKNQEYDMISDLISNLN
jgi:hypothetical protein